jgi:putative transposase
MSMYAKGLSNRDISAVIHGIYGFDVSHDTVSRIVERVQPRFTAWQSRPLEKVCAFVYVDAMVVKVKAGGRARNKAVYSVPGPGIDMEGHKGIGPLDR